MDTTSLAAYVKRNCSALDELIASLCSGESAEIMDTIRDCSSPESAAGRISDLLSGPGAKAVREIIRDCRTCSVFMATVSGSSFLFQVLRRNRELLERFFLEGHYVVRKDREIQARELDALLKGISEVSDFDRELRRHKDREYLRIGCRDLSGLADVREVMEELSDLAAASIQAALDFHWERLIRLHGPPPGLSEGTGLAVIALGKLSGRELNFSSDVDLIFLRSIDKGMTSGPKPLPVAGFYESLCRSLMQSLSRITDDGFVFRVDVRLRPEGERGELVPSLSNALEYYWSWGRTWERAALMKAEPVAGDTATGRAFVKALEPFVYRRHLDYSTIEEMREMKLAIEAQLRRKPGINIKLGQGGIREVEFFVQALQLINAGRTPKIRTPGTVEALRLLQEAGLLDEQTATGLRDAYVFFRKAEHRIQINHQVQTHELPRTTEDQQELAKRIGYRENALVSFMADLEKRRKFVEDLFSGLFHTAQEQSFQDCSVEALAIVESASDEEKCAKLLTEYGIQDPEDSCRLLKGLVVPSDRRIMWERGRKMLERLAPLFVDELIKTPEPRKALLALDRYIGSLHSHASYFSTLLENPPTARFLVKVLGESRFFAELLIRHPQSIDSLIGRWTAQYQEGKASMAKNLDERLIYSDSYEQQLDVLRIFKNEQILRIGVRQLSGELDAATARRRVTILAEVCLEEAVGIARSEMDRKFGECGLGEPLPFVILGMGKLGGSEMSYLSDVDVIFIYNAPEPTVCSMTAHEWFTRLAQRVISTLSVHTGEGAVFEIDTRLRPSGNKGPLVSSLSSFRDYHETTSKLWEKQALTKARPVTGPERLATEVQEIVRNCVLRTDLSDSDLAEMARLRNRMENELAQEDKRHVDLKTGQGGLVDVEFFVQAKILAEVKKHPEILIQNTLDALGAIKKAGLINKETFETLDLGYRFLINLEDRLRIMEHRSVDRLPLEGDKLKGLARRLGYQEGNESQLVEDYFKVTDSVRKTYELLFVNTNQEE